MFTQRAALLGFVAFCFYLIAVVNSLPTFYFALTWLAVGMLGASLGIALLSLIGVELQFEVSQSRALAAFESDTGEGPKVRIQLSNSGTLNKTGIVLALGLRDIQQDVPAKAANQKVISGRARRNASKITQIQRFVIEAVPSGAAIEVVLPLRNLRRGHYALEEAQLTGSDVLGLFRVRKRFLPREGVAHEIIVGPPVLPAEGFEISRGGGARSGSRRTVQTGQGDELRGTRPYAPGDDLRHVHWKSSARAGELVVKEFEQTGRSKVLVIWDGAAGTTWGAEDWNSTEWGLALCASLCHAFLSQNTPCDLARLDAFPLLVSGRALGRDQLPLAFVDALAAARSERTSTLEQAVRGIPSLSGRNYSSVLLITASLAADVGQHARFWRSRGARVQVLVLDGAAIGAQSDRRFRSRVTRVPNQESGDSSIAVTSANYQNQRNRVRADGIETILVQPADEGPQAALRAALRELQRSRPIPAAVLADSASAK